MATIGDRHGRTFDLAQHRGDELFTVDVGGRAVASVPSHQLVELVSNGGQVRSYVSQGSETSEHQAAANLTLGMPWPLTSPMNALVPKRVSSTS